MKNLLFIDTSYTFKQIEERDSLNIIYSRDLNKFFDKVISVHPTANLTDKTLYKIKSYYKKYIIDDRHTFIEFKSLNLEFLFFIKYISFLYFQLRMIFKLIKIIKNEKITEIKCGDINYAGLIGIILSKLTGIKYYVRVGSNNDKIRNEIQKPIQKKLFKLIKIEKFFEKIILSNASHIFPANKDNAKFVSKYINNNKKITVIRYGPLINECHYKLRSKRIINSKDLKKIQKTNKKIITCIARFEKVKKVDDVIYLFKKLLDQKKDLLLYLVGDGSLKNEYISLTKNLDIYDNIIFTGDKNQIWISELLSLTDLVISPHTGRALCEAALAGCKVVGYDIDWQSEIIDHNINGILVKYGDIKKLNFYALEMLNNTKKYKNFGESLRTKAMDILDKHKSLTEEIKVYNQ